MKFNKNYKRSVWKRFGTQRISIILLNTRDICVTYTPPSAFSFSFGFLCQLLGFRALPLTDLNAALVAAEGYIEACSGSLPPSFPLLMIWFLAEKATYRHPRRSQTMERNYLYARAASSQSSAPSPLCR